MEGDINEYYTEEHKKMINIFPKNERGIALITALLISVVIMLIASSTLYFITQSTIMSGAGKRYATADEAANGALEVAKKSIGLGLVGDPLPSVIQSGAAFTTAIKTVGVPGIASFNLPATTGGNYTVTMTVTMLYSLELPGARIEFAAAKNAPPAKATYFKIDLRVASPKNEVAEITALYRYVPSVD